MRTIADAYEEFSKMVLEDHIYEDDTIDFQDICRALRVAPADLNEVLVEEMGMNGPEILQYFQKLLNL
ncbi:MAG: hypothetical protein K6F21_07665 [Bacteroidales bacterium]|nr:hypothetical protein [Bacteroidales bacterium]